MHSSGTTAISGMAPSFLSIPAHLRSGQEIHGRHAAINGHGLPIHPAFQFQAYPFYPGSLLSAIRQPANGFPKQQLARDTAPKGSGSKSFTIDAILASDKDAETSSREGTPEEDPEDKPAHAPDITRVGLVAASRRPDVLYPFQGHTQGLAHCPAAIRYGHFNPGK
ncbi:hypothetical protein LSH36_508g02031 [Paralvinella palmiformis]|uniref:Uncharacterized protein n=1 Tax=Paralvinella palmiformis TaxID=53620 RepID=A0AAD9J844_9ANNE|nr:hypothetical protein LSH36_508g02031 [Paralvinella palmiformis]